MISSIVGSQLDSNVVLIVLILTPALIAHCLYAGQAGSITITSSPGLSTVEMERNTPNLAPGAIKILSEAHGQDPEFYRFLRQLETYENTFNTNTTIIIPKDSNILNSFFGANKISGNFPQAPKVD